MRASVGKLWEAGFTYTASMSQNSALGKFKKLSLNVRFFDSVCLSPYLAVAVDLGGQADGCGNEGPDLKVGIKPAIRLPDDVPVSLSAPVLVGLGLSDYYEAKGQDNTCGSFNLGLSLGVPFSGMPERYGSWKLTAGVQSLMFGDGLKVINDSDDDFKATGVVNLSLDH